jgi:4'-phosphopantetheinyl transferase EntD
MTTDLDAALQTLALPTVRTGSRCIDPTDVAHLAPVEWLAVERAVLKRQREFATGRVLLRQLLECAGAIPVDGGRAPRWPPGFCGSLAHDDAFAVAAVSDSRAIRALGIDVEPTVALQPALARMILRPDEGDLDAHLALSLKEAAYKAWSALGGRMIDHLEMRLTVDGERFTAVVVKDGARLNGRYVVAHDRTVALVVVPA